MTKCALVLFAIAFNFYSCSVWAVDCQQADTLVENTICNNDNLRWLDKTLAGIYRANLDRDDTQQVRKNYQQWQRSLQNCTSENCIRRAYYQGINLVSNVNNDTKWEGQWWNTSAPNMSGGMLQFTRSTDWSVATTVRLWAGVNRDEFTAEARKVNGMALINNIRDVNDCLLLIIPQQDGSLQVHSNINAGCDLIMPDGAFADGTYQRASSDPRPAASLLSLGVLPTEALDKEFRALVGDDYQGFVDTANAFVYEDDQDKQSATVISMWLRGAANRHTAIIMYNDQGNIWAARLFPSAKDNDKLQMHYFSTLGDKEPMPRTLDSWKARYLDK